MIINLKGEDLIWVERMVKCRHGDKQDFLDLLGKLAVAKQYHIKPDGSSNEIRIEGNYFRVHYDDNITNPRLFYKYLYYFRQPNILTAPTHEHCRHRVRIVGWTDGNNVEEKCKKTSNGYYINGENLFSMETINQNITM